MIDRSSGFLPSILSVDRSRNSLWDANRNHLRVCLHVLDGKLYICVCFVYNSVIHPSNLLFSFPCNLILFLRGLTLTLRCPFLSSLRVICLVIFFLARPPHPPNVVILFSPDYLLTATSCLFCCPCCYIAITTIMINNSNNNHSTINIVTNSDSFFPICLYPDVLYC